MNNKRKKGKLNIVSGSGLPLLDKDDVIVSDNTKKVAKNTKNDANKRIITAKRYKDVGDGYKITSNLLEGITIIGAGRAKKKLINMLEKWQKNASRYKEMGIPPDFGVIIYGMPGVGKSELAKQIMRKFGDIYINVRLMDIAPGSYLEKRTKGIEVIRQALNKIKLEIIAFDCTYIVLLDEITALFPKRGKKSTGIIATERTEALLKEIDIVIDDDKVRGKVFFIGTTNYIQRLDTAVFRSGRFHRVAILLPNYKERIELVKMFLGNLAVTIDGKTYEILDIINAEEVAELTEGFSGADIKVLRKEMFDMMLDKEATYSEIIIKDITRVIREHSLNTTNAALMEIAEFEAEMEAMEKGKGTGSMIEDENVEF